MHCLTQNPNYQRIVMRLLVAFSSVMFALTMNASVRAGCGDYVILTGELPSWMNDQDRKSMTHARFDAFDSKAWQDFQRIIPSPLPAPSRCDGMSCDSSFPMMTSPISTESQQRVPVFACEKHRTPRIDERESFRRPLDSSISQRRAANRLDRPPQVA